MHWRSEWKSLFWVLAVFLTAYFLPITSQTVTLGISSGLDLLQWYAREHVLLCLIPAFFIAGTISVFISQAAVIKYFGSEAKKWVSYLIASVSGSILAVCSCTVLPLFSGIHKRGAGLGPAITFLYSGPAINILAIILTARVLGFNLGIARVIGAVVFSVVIGLIMHFIYRKEEAQRAAGNLAFPETDEARPFWQTVIHFVILVGILIFATWGTGAGDTGVWAWIFQRKWLIVSLWGLGLGASLIFILKMSWWQVTLSSVPVIAAALYTSNPLVAFATSVVMLTILLSFNHEEPGEWLGETWGFAKQILPLLAAGVMVAGFLLGSPEHGGGIIPGEWISQWVGGNSLWSNLFASVVGAFMYFATLTEIPILQGLLNNGMGQGPALALLLAGPALSLPNMLVIRSVIGTQKTVVYVVLVVVMATVSGLIFGAFF